MLRCKGLLLSVMFLIMSGCAYSTASLMPVEAESIYVPIFINETYKQTIDQRPFKKDIENIMTDEVIREFLVDPTLKVVYKNYADLSLQGRVISYELQPLRYSDTDLDVVEEYRIHLTVSLDLVDLRDNSIIFEDRRISQREEYYVGGTTIDPEDSALILATRDLAKQIVIQVTEGWS